jgi:hypothetical protein
MTDARRPTWAPSCRSGSHDGEGAPDALQRARLRHGPGAGGRVDHPADELSASDGIRFATIVLQAATLVAAVRTSGLRHRDTRAAALIAVAIVITSAIAWAIHGDISKAPALAGVLAIYLLAGMFFSFLHSFVTLCTVGYGC